MIIICDIDGVLADCHHRLCYKEEKDYEAFYGVCMADDKPIEAGADLLTQLLAGSSYVCNERKVIFLTGRPERTRSLTQNWLDANIKGKVSHLYSYELLMRKDDDHRKPSEVKVELLKPTFYGLGKMKRKVKDFWSERLHDRVFYVDDDPTNIKAVCEAYPEIIGLTFGTTRMEEMECEN